MKPELFTPEQRAEIAAMIAAALAPANQQIAERMAMLRMMRQPINLEVERQKMLAGGIDPVKVEDWYQRACAYDKKYPPNQAGEAVSARHQ